MSYILDALRKSEQERHAQDSVPSIQTIHSSQTTQRPVSIRWMPIVIVVSIAVILGLYIMGTRDTIPDYKPVDLTFTDTAETHTPANTTSIVAPNASASVLQQALNASGRQPPVVPKATDEVAALYQQRDETTASSPVASSVVKTPPASPPVNTVPAVEAAPAKAIIANINDIAWSIKSHIPSIEYTAHIYAADKHSGFVILNGAKKHAGDKLRSGTYVEKIEEDGVVLNHNGVLFKLAAMKSWNN